MEQYEYDAFGQPYFFSSTAQPTNYSTFGNRFLFTGREWLSDLKMYDYRNRMYQPELGRFLQPNPKHFTARDYNLYRYCHNDPVNHSDPTGLTIEYDYPTPAESSAARALINRLERMGGDIGARVRLLQDPRYRVRFIPIQRTDAGFNKYSLPRHERGEENTNRTTPRNEPNSRNGTGLGSQVELDPNNWTAGNRRRDPVEAAGHEVDHAAANFEGKRLGSGRDGPEERRARDFTDKVHKKVLEGK